MKSEFFRMKVMKAILAFLVGCLLLLVPGVSGDDTDEVSVSAMEGDSVLLHTGVDTNKEDRMTWYFNNSRIAYLNGEKNKICTDDRCSQRFGDRLDLTDSSLTITNINTSDAGVYKVEITSRYITKSFRVTVRDVPAAERDQMKRKSVKEGQSVILDPGVGRKTDVIMWYFNETHIDINSCTDVGCNEGTERFRDRLKLDHQTGSLTITDIRDPASGLYRLRVISSDTITEKIFFVAVYDVSAAEQDEMKRKSVKKGESVTLDPGEIKNLNDSMTWYFSDIIIAEITGDPNKTCKDGQCEDPDGRFRNRLHLDHQTGSLTITNTTITDSGEYTLQMNRSRISLIRIFSVIVTDSRVSSAAKGGVFAVVVVVVVLLFTAAAVAAGIYYRHRKSTQGRNGIIRLHRYNEGNGALHSEWGLTDDC